MEILNTWEYASIIEQFFYIDMSDVSTVFDFCVQVVPFFNHIINLHTDIFLEGTYDLKNIDVYNIHFSELYNIESFLLPIFKVFHKF